MADKIVVLRDGRVEQVGVPLELYNRPANRFVAGFIGSPRMNFLSASVVDAAEDRISLTAPGMPVINIGVSGTVKGAGVTLGVRPEHLSPSTEGWPLEVEVVEQLGGASYLYGRLPSGDRLVVSEAGQTRARPGETIRVSAAERDLHVFSSADGEAALSRRIQ